MSKEDRRAGTCNLSPGPTTCLNCPFPECTNNRPPVRGEDGVEKYVNLIDGTKENVMKTKYEVGDIVKVGAKIEGIKIDKKGVKYILSSRYWEGLKEVREGDLSSGSSKSTPKTSEKPKKASKTAKNSRKTAENGKELQKNEESKEKQQGGTEGPKAAERQQDTAKRQQERKRPGRPSKKATGENEGRTTAAGLEELAKELAGAAE